MYVSIHIIKICKTVDLAILNISLHTHTFVCTHIFKIVETTLVGLNNCSSENIRLITFSLKDLKT